MTDLDYAKVTGRFGLTVADGVDVDDNPDTIWCDEGTVQITPLITYVKVAGGSPDPWTAGNSVITATINSNGYLEFNGKQYVYVVDLTSSKVNPQIGANKATHRITFKNLKAGGTPVDFPTGTVRITKDGPALDGINDLTTLLPVDPGVSSPIYRGEQGIGIADASIAGGTNLQFDLTDGTTVDAGALPVGPGGSDAGVAGYFGNPSSLTSAALDPRMAALIALFGSDTRDALMQAWRDFVATLPTYPLFDLQDYGGIPNNPAAEVGSAYDAAVADLLAYTAAGGAGGRLFFSPDATGKAHYYTARSLRTTVSGAPSATYRSQLPLPANPCNGNKFYIGILGSMPAMTPFNVVDNTVQTNGAIIESTLTGVTYDGNGVASVLGGPYKALTGTGFAPYGFTDLHVMVSNLRVRTPANPSLSAVDFGYVTQTDVEMICDTPELVANTAFTQPTHRHAVGYIAPRTNNNAVNRIRRLIVTGYYCGLLPGEHLDANEVVLASNFIAMGHVNGRDTGGHPNNIHTLTMEWNTHGISGLEYDNGETGVWPGANALNIQTLSIEDNQTSGNWRRPVDHINDSKTTADNPGLVGKINYTLSAVGGRIVNGLKIKLNPSTLIPPYAGITDLAMMASGTDTLGTFSTTASNGSAVPAPTPSGAPWSAWGATLGSAWQIQSNLAKIAGGASGNQVQSTGGARTHNPTVTASVTLSATSYYVGVAVKVVDASNWFAVVYHSGKVKIVKCVAGTPAEPFVSGTISGVTTGATRSLKAVVRADTIYAYDGGTLIGSYQMSATEYATFQSASRVGYFAAASAGEAGDSGVGPLTVTIP